MRKIKGEEREKERKKERKETKRKEKVYSWNQENVGMTHAVEQMHNRNV